MLEIPYQYATLNRRMFAALIDTLIITILFTPIMNYISYMILKPGDYESMQQFMTNAWLMNVQAANDILNNSTFMIKNLMIQFIALMLLIIVTVPFWHFKGATPGKMLARCRIVDANTGLDLSYKQSIIRAFSYLLSAMIFCVGFFMIAFTKKNQGLHDKIANTVVIVIPK